MRNKHVEIMKKIKVIGIAALAALATPALADGYPYLTLYGKDGSEVSLPAAGLKITFVDGNLVAETAGGAKSVPLGGLGKMAFSQEAAGMRSLPAPGKPVEVKTLDGVPVGRYSDVEEAAAALRQGAYVVVSGEKAYKLILK